MVVTNEDLIKALDDVNMPLVLSEDYKVSLKTEIQDAILENLATAEGVEF